VVRKPEWAQTLGPELLDQLPDGHRRLVRWVAGLSRQGVLPAGLFERVLAMGEAAADDRSLFLSCWAPDPAADALMEADAETQQGEWQRIVGSLRLRSLEAQAAQLAAGVTEQDRTRLRSVRLEIAQLKEMLSSTA
jgi:hypothetical protein